MQKALTSGKNGYRITSAANTEKDGNNETTRNIGGVAIIIEPELAAAARKITRTVNRITTITFDTPGNATPVAITVAYAPRKAYANCVEIDFRNELQKQLPGTEKRHLRMLLIDANGQVSASNTVKYTNVDKTIGPHTNIKRLEWGNGMALRNTCVKNDMRIANTWYMNKQNDTGKHTTWRSPNGNQSRQIDYVRINQTYPKNTVNCSRPAKGRRANANQNNQHSAVLAKIQPKYANNWRKEAGKEGERNNNKSVATNYDKN